MKTCSRCEKSKPLSAFNKKNNGKDSQCRMCRAAYWTQWYAKPSNRREHIRQSKKHAAIRQRIVLAKMRDLKGGPCTDCGGTFPPWVMQFDHLPHRGKKRANVSKLSAQGYSEKIVLAEIAKCELVCANCHADRTYHRNIRGSQRAGALPCKQSRTGSLPVSSTTPSSFNGRTRPW